MSIRCFYPKTPLPAKEFLTDNVAGTLGLLKASLPLSISSFFTLYTAFLILDVEPRVELCAGFGFWVYSVYTLDRAMGGAEDDVNREELAEASKTIAYAAVAFSFTASVAILNHSGLSPLGAVFPFAVGLLYSKGVRIGSHRFRLKGSLGGKNVVVGITWAGSIVLFTYPWLNEVTLSVVGSYFFMKLAINTVIYDCRDVTGDRLAGVRTIPVVLGYRDTGLILQGLNAVLHVGLTGYIVSGYLEFPLILAVCSGALGAFYVWVFTRSGGTPIRCVVDRNEWLRDLLVDGEWLLIVVFVTAYRFFGSYF